MENVKFEFVEIGVTLCLTELKENQENQRVEKFSVCLFFLLRMTQNFKNDRFRSEKIDKRVRHDDAELKNENVKQTLFSAIFFFEILRFECDSTRESIRCEFLSVRWRTRRDFDQENEIEKRFRQNPSEFSTRRERRVEI